MANNKERKRSPLNCIPSVDAVRQRLETVLTEARKLRVLLRTAKEIEETQSREGKSRE